MRFFYHEKHGDDVYIYLKIKGMPFIPNIVIPAFSFMTNNIKNILELGFRFLCSSYIGAITITVRNGK